jgi:Spy/CpxP family protein refolding chaperone
MEAMGTTFRKTVGILAVLAVIPASGWAFGGPAGGGRIHGPPQEAIDACAGKKPGDAVRFITPCGDNVAAVCTEKGGRLAAAPERGAGWAGRGHRGKGKGMGPGRHFARMARDLDLTAEQKGQIKTILDAEREKNAPIRKRIADNRNELRKLAEKEPFDEAAVRRLAAEQEKTRTELAVARARAMNRVHALLTPEQREKARTLRTFGEDRRGRFKGM